MTLSLAPQTSCVSSANRKPPRVGFVGTGQLLQSLGKSGLVEIAGVTGVAPPRARRRHGASRLPPIRSLNQLLEMELDGLVIAEGGAPPLDQALAGLERGLAVFCQTPVGWTAAAARQAVGAARRQDCLLGVDFPYRRLTGAEQIRGLLREKEMGAIFAADFVFHVARRPRQSWFGELAREGCATGLGFHLIDLALWCLDYPRVVEVSSQLLARGRPTLEAEDFASVRLILQTGASVQISCSWKLPPGCGTIISGAFCGTKGTAQFHNIGGSLTRFGAWRSQPGMEREALPSRSRPRNAAGALEWARHLAQETGYDAAIESLVTTVATLDRMRGK